MRNGAAAGAGPDNASIFAAAAGVAAGAGAATSAARGAAAFGLAVDADSVSNNSAGSSSGLVNRRELGRGGCDPFASLAKAAAWPLVRRGEA